MGQGNKATRNYAIPFIANFIDGSSTWGSSFIEFPDLLASHPYIAAAVMSRPDKGDIVEAYLYMEMTAPSDMALNVRLAIGTFDTLITPDLVYSNSYLQEQHRKIAGTDDPYTVAANGTLIIDADLTRNLHRRGDAEFNPDGFVLLVIFDSDTTPPDPDNGYSLDKFKLSCTAQMGFGT